LDAGGRQLKRHRWVAIQAPNNFQCTRIKRFILDIMGVKMINKQRFATIVLSIVSVLTITIVFSSCGPGQLLGPSLTPTPTPKPIRSRGDLHMHTTCSDGENTYEEMIQASLETGYDFIAITDHTMCDDVITKCKNETRLLCVPGQEIEAGVHIVALGIQQTIEGCSSVKECVAEIHRQGGFAIAAHPYSFSPAYTDEEMFDSGLDARECQDDPYFSRLVDGEWVKIKIPEIPCSFGRDAHSVKDLGVRFGECDGDIKTYDDLITAISGFKCHYPIW
jgi:hypothetical protein